jgi:hypothetical protein
MLNLEQTCNNPHHDAPPDRNRAQGYRRGLASLSVVKELLFRVHRNVLFGRITARPISLQDLSGGTYSFALRELAFQLCLPQLALSFCLVF